MKSRVGQLAGIGFLLMTTLGSGSCLAEISYLFVGQGTVRPFSALGIVGEVVEVSFEYRLSDFDDIGGGSWPANRDIVPRAIGSRSGEITGLAAVGRFGAGEFRPVQQVQVQFDTRTLTGGLLQGLGVALASSRSTSLVTPLPPLLATVHERFLAESQAGIWTDFPTATIASENYGPPSFDVLALEDYSWEILVIPEPSALALVVASVCMMHASGRWASKLAIRPASGLPLRRFRNEHAASDRA